jgi:hypothetical protein
MASINAVLMWTKEHKMRLLFSVVIIHITVSWDEIILTFP